MKGSDETNTGNQPVPKGKPPQPMQGASSSGPSLASIEDKEVFDQNMARTIGSHLGVYHGQDWAGPTPGVRQQTGMQMLEEATNLRETGHLVEGLALAIEIGKEQPLEPEEAMGRFKSGVDSLGTGLQTEATLLPVSPGQGIPSDAPGSMPKTSPQASFHETLLPDEQDSYMSPDTEQGSQLELEGWEMADPDNLEG